MKKKPASAPEPLKTSASKARRTSKTDVAPAAAAATSSATEKSKRAPHKPLLEAAVDSVKKMLSARSTAKKSAAEKPKVEAEAPTVVRHSSKRRKKEEVLDVPPILLEGDAPVESHAGGPGQKYSLGATPPAQSFSGGELPESYGTKKLFLTARDPHWLYAHWDLTREQQNELNAESTDGHLILRIFTGKI